MDTINTIEKLNDITNCNIVGYFDLDDITEDEAQESFRNYFSYGKYCYITNSGSFEFSDGGRIDNLLYNH